MFVREDLNTQNLERSRGASPVDIWRKRVSVKGNSQGKGPKDEHPVCLGNSTWDRRPWQNELSSERR